MANTIKLKRGSGSDPGSSDLSVGEVALRTDNGTLFTKNDAGNITEIGASSGVSDGDKGDITVSSSGATWTIDSGAIDNANINASAAIAGTKISPAFGNQTISTTAGITAQGHAAVTGTPNTYTYGRGSSGGGLSIYAAEAAIEAVSTDDGSHASSLLLRSVADGAGFVYNPTTNALELKTFTPTGDDFNIHATGGNVSSLITQLRVVKDGQVELAHNGNVKLSTSSSGVDVTGNIAVTGTVDGVDLAALNTAAARKDGTDMGATTFRVDGADFIVKDSTDSVANFIWRDHGNSQLRIGTADAVVTARSNVMPLSDSTYDLGSNGTRWTNIYGDNIYGSGANLTSLNASNISSGTIAAARVATLNQNTTGSSGSCTGNAATATALATARTIAGVSFDGSANISLNNNAITNGAGYITSADGGNAATLDGIDSSSFLRSDTDDTASGQLTLTYSNPYPLNIDNSSDAKINLQGSSSPYVQFREGSSGKAYIQWNTSGYLTLVNEESGDQLKIDDGASGLIWRVGTTDYTVWNSGNDGSGSGLDADTVDGIGSGSFLRSDADDTASGKLTLTDHLTLEDTYLRVGDVSNDNWLRLTQATADGYGFDWQHNNAAVMINEQGTTNQALVLGDVNASDDYEGLFGIAHSGDGGSSWTKKLDLKGNGALYVGSSAQYEVWHSGNSSKKNLIINGDMQIAQRGTSSTNDGFHTVDRFAFSYGGENEMPTQAQHVLTSSDTGPWEEGFRHSFHITNGNQTGGAGASDYAYIDHKLESQDLATCGWDYTSSNSYITLSFWVKSSVAQTFHGFLLTFDSTDKLYSFNTGALSANTWTKVTKVIPGSGPTFDNDNGIGMLMRFSAFMGTSWTGSMTQNQWATYNSSLRTPDQTSTWWTTNNATFEMTGVQFEVGAVASPFQHKTHGEQLALCQRYFAVYHPTSQERIYIEGSATNHRWWEHPIPAGMRTEPSVAKGGTCSTLSVSMAGGFTINGLTVTGVDNGGSSGTLHPGSMGNVSYRVSTTGGGGSQYSVRHTDGWAHGNGWITMDAEL